MFQALGAASTMPLLMNVLLTSFPIEKRGMAMGVFGLVMNFAPAIGPTLSGWIIEHYDWRMLFHMITPIAILILVFAFFMLKDTKETKDLILDKLSVVLSSVGFGVYFMVSVLLLVADGEALRYLEPSLLVLFH